MPKFNICKCFYTDNYFVSAIRAHMRYESDEQFQRDYAEVPGKRGVSMDSMLSEVKKEKRRRCEVIEGFAVRRALIKEKYIPLHKDIFGLQERFFDQRFLSLWRSVCEGGKAPLLQYRIAQERFGLYQFPLFTDEFCQWLTEEVANFRKTDLPNMRPNTMNYHGVLLDELGFTNFIDALRTKYLNPMALALYPEWTGAGLDSHRAFTVAYHADDDVNHTSNGRTQQQQRDLAIHFDNAEVTLNVALDTDYEGGEIYFGNVRTGPNAVEDVSTQDAFVEHKRGWGLFHRARQLHGALPVEKGRRENLIIWMRSSSVRNRECPMCWKEPALIPVCEGCYGDGFTS